MTLGLDPPYVYAHKQQKRALYKSYLNDTWLFLFHQRAKELYTNAGW